MSMRKTLGELASEYAQKSFPVYPEKDDIRNIGKHDVAFHAFADGWNAAKEESPWVRAEDSLPCTDEKLVDCTGRIPRTKYVLVKRRNGHYSVDLMKKYGDRDWIWVSYNDIIAWMPIPEFK